MGGQKFYCETCGREVPADVERCPGCGKEFYGVKCPVCGLSGPPGAFADGCPKCGFQSGKGPGARANTGGKTGGKTKGRSGKGVGKEPDQWFGFQSGAGKQREKGFFPGALLPDWAVFLLLLLLAGLTGLLSWLLYARLV